MSLFRDPPALNYVDTGSGYIAYQVFGDGPVDLLYKTALDSHAIAMWDSPLVGRFFDRLASFSRVVTFDWRGTGASDPVLDGGTTLDVFIDDIGYVIDAVGMEDVVLVGDREAGPAACLYAGTYPLDVRGLVLVNSFAKMIRADGYDIGLPPDAFDHLLTWMQDHWGKDDYFLNTAPSIESDIQLRRWLARMLQYAAAPGSIELIMEFYRQTDTRDILSSISTETLVISRSDATYYRPAYSRYLANHIPNATLTELPGADTAPFFAGDVEPVLDAIEEFVTGSSTQTRTSRTLATVLFTDIIDSTATASRMGDQAWLDTLTMLDRSMRDHVAHFRGDVVKNTGDGLLAIFDGPTRATECAEILVEAGARLGVEVRAGLHTGEIERQPDGDIVGIAVHIASRVTDTRQTPGVTVSSTVRSLTAGSGLSFTDFGLHDLKGVPDPWQLFELEM
ncbi:MAG: alpha/beta fold hydrolase [Acidimicrobiia bacterium]